MRVIVIGAGIGGATAALGLQRNGVEVKVFDRAAEPTHTYVGSGMQLAPNGLNALNWVQPGLVDAVTRSGVILEHMEFRGWRGNLLADWPIGDWGRKAGRYTVGIRRGQLQQLVSSALDEGTIQFGRGCAGFEQDDREVRVRFEDGSEEHADVLVGADGVQSVVRRELLGDGGPEPAGYTSLVGFVPPDGDLLEHERLRQFIGHGLRLVVFHVDPETLCWVGYVGARVAARVAPDGGASAKADAVRAFEGWPSALGALIERTPGDGVWKSEGLARGPVDRWGRGRVTLLGDAAHPMVSFGQGANQAIEDAVVLVRSLLDERDEVAALRTYETKRIPRTATLTRTAWRSVKMLHWNNPVAAMLRDRIIIPAVSKTVLPKLQTSTYTYRASHA
jgi:2-polyprenyl-6-methoxyphenol hydroxylase-like FAD-dependent oxidoreductase